MSRRLAIACAVLLPAIAGANGRPPITNGVHFRPGDNQAVYVSSTFGLLVSPDGCSFYWVCENNLGYGGEYDPAYAVSPTGAIFATTFHGMRESHDGGCSFTTATAELPATDPGNISALYFSAVEIGPTGEVWVGTSETGSGNAVFRSTDDGVSFAPRGALPTSMWFKSIKVAPTDPQRVYVTAFQVSGSTMPPSAHLFRSDDGGATWTEEPLANVVLNSSPTVLIAAVDPANADILYMRSAVANPPNGDKLYRSTDGGVTFAEVLSLAYPISDVVVRDPHTVIAASQYGGAFQSVDGGVTFTALANPPQLACLGQRGDGVLFGCGAAYDPDHMALGKSFDAVTWQPVLKFEYITGTLHCPSGTVEEDTCNNQLWRGLSQQFGITEATCSAGPDGATDAPPVDGPPSHKSGGCCDAGEGGGETATLVVAGALLVRRRRRAG